MACAIPHPPCLLSVDRSLSPPTFSFLLLFLALLFPPVIFFSAFSSPSIFSFSFIHRPILVHVPLASFVWSTDGETRVHIFVTMMCVILRAGIRGANTNGRERKRGKDGENKREKKGEGKRESEMMRECYKEKRKGT